MCIISSYISLYRYCIFYWGSILRKAFQNTRICFYWRRTISGNDNNVCLYGLSIGVFFMKSSVIYNLKCIFQWLCVCLYGLCIEVFFMKPCPKYNQCVFSSGKVYIYSLCPRSMFRHTVRIQMLMWYTLHGDQVR